MAIKNLIMDAHEDSEGYRTMTILSGSVKDEAICAEFHTSQGEPDILEMAISVEDMIKMRDFISNIISKIEGN